jgi:hypothetical protein
MTDIVAWFDLQGIDDREDQLDYWATIGVLDREYMVLMADKIKRMRKEKADQNDGSSSSGSGRPPREVGRR